MRGKKIFGSRRSEKEKTWQADAGRSHTRSLNGRVEPAVAFQPEAARVAAVKRGKKNRKPTKMSIQPEFRRTSVSSPELHTCPINIVPPKAGGRSGGFFIYWMGAETSGWS